MAPDREPPPPAVPSQWRRCIDYLRARPVFGMFAFMAPAMVAILLVSIQNVPLEPTQRLAMVVATVGLAAACAWTIAWE